MRREDFIFTIGFDGGTAIIDGKAKKRYGRLNTEQLADKGLYKPAFCAAIFDNDEQSVQYVIRKYNENIGTSYTTADELKRLFGVDENEIGFITAVFQEGELVEFVKTNKVYGEGGRVCRN